MITMVELKEIELQFEKTSKRKKKNLVCLPKRSDMTVPVAEIFWIRQML